MDDRTFGEKIADNVAEFAGSWKFIIIFGLMLMGWILANSIFLFYHFDPYPFILLNLILSFVAAFQAPFIMMSQNRAEKKQDIAYRAIFEDLKDLMEQSKQDVNRLIDAQNKLFDELHSVVITGQNTIVEVLEQMEEEIQ